jgi:beta-glucosidase
MRAGCDIEMMSSCYGLHLEELIDEGKITEEQLDKAVLRILDLKEELGVLDNPYRSVDVEESKRIQLCPEHRALARHAAEESAVLLKNDNILPFSKDVSSVALIGPLGATGEIHGTWHCGGKASETISVFDGMKNLLGEKSGDETLVESLCAYNNVNEKTPKAFIWHTFDDAGVNVKNSLAYAWKLKEFGIQCEMHVYQNGPHGLGLARENLSVGQWSDSLKIWLMHNNILGGTL